MSEQRIAYVTGGTGFVGSHLVERLVQEGYHVRALVLEHEDASFLERLGVELLRGDITDSADKLRAGFEGVTHVFHCAGWVDDWAPRKHMVAVNVHGLRNVLKACSTADLQRFVFVGSIMVYGAGDQIDLDESAPFVGTGDNYNYTKIQCERVVREFVHRRGVPAVVLRPTYIYGERDNHFLPRVLRSLQHGHWIFLSGGKMPFTLVHVQNLVDACVLAATREEAVGEGFIITDGESITRRELMELVCEELDCEMPWLSLPRHAALPLLMLDIVLAKVLAWDRPNLINRFLYHFAGCRLTFDISKARRLLGYEPKRPTPASLRTATRWFKENRPDLLPRKREHSG